MDAQAWTAPVSGEHVERDGFVCLVSAGGVRCAGPDRRHGMWVSVAGYELF